MRLVDLDKFKSTRKKITLHSSILFGAPTGIILFILSIGAGFLPALLFALLFGGGLFLLVFFIREATHKGVERKRKKVNTSNTVLDVLLNNEIGLLEISKEKLIFHNLTPGGAEKSFEILITSDLFISVGEIKYTQLQKLKHKGIKSGFILLKNMPNGLPKQFVFYNIDNVLETVFNMLNEISIYKE